MIKLLSILMLSAFLCGCASIKVQTIVQEPRPDFSAYQSYAFLQRPPGEKAYGSLLAENELIYGIQDEMEIRNIKPDSLQPQLLVSFNASSSYKQKQVQSNVGNGLSPFLGAPLGWRMPMYAFADPFFWGPGMIPPFPQATRTVTERQGTIEIIFFDREEKRIVWRGVASGDANDPYENVKSSLRKLFRQFPVKPQKSAPPKL